MAQQLPPEKAFFRLKQGIAEALNEFPEQAFITSGIAFKFRMPGLPPPAPVCRRHFPIQLRISFRSTQHF